MLLPRVHRILSLLHTELLAHCLTYDPANTKECPIQLGSLLHSCLQTPQIINVHKTDTMTTQLHESLLSGNRHLRLQCGHHTLTGGRAEPTNQKTNALPSSLLFKHIHTN